MPRTIAEIRADKLYLEEVQTALAQLSRACDLYLFNNPYGKARVVVATLLSRAEHDVISVGERYGLVAMDLKYQEADERSPSRDDG